MVNTLAPLTCSAKTLQDLVAAPSTSTVQAPHWAVSQPWWVPVSPSCSRSKSTSRVEGGTAKATGWPLTCRLT